MAHEREAAPVPHPVDSASFFRARPSREPPRLTCRMLRFLGVRPRARRDREPARRDRESDRPRL